MAWNDGLVGCALAVASCEQSPYTKETALLAGPIDGEQQSRGVVIPFGDLLTGATALSLGYQVLTGNLRHFQKIPGLSVIQF